MLPVDLCSTHKGETLHLHIVPADSYDAGVFGTVLSDLVRGMASASSTLLSLSPGHLRQVTLAPAVLLPPEPASTASAVLRVRLERPSD
jgi:hypothetical protein